MTEGAKTGTPITDAAKFDCQPGNPMLPKGSWVVPLAIAEQLERDKTEALKVAGEALNYIGHSSSTPQKQKHKCWTALAALERIRNKG